MTQQSLMPLEVLWQPRVIISALLAGEALALILALSPGASSDRWVYFGLASLMIQWVTFLTLSFLVLARERAAALDLGRLGLLVVLLMVGAGWLVGGVAWLLFQQSAPLATDSAFGFFARLTGICVTVGLLTMAALQNHLRVKLLALRATQAELESLQARTHPHFLFNTLNTAAALVHARPDEAERVLLDLSDLFRAALSAPHHIPLSEELALTRRYVEIERLRLDQRLEVLWELPALIPEAQVPALSIQPLVENAVRHGIERRVRGGRVDILVAADGEWAHVTVRNDLPGLTFADGKGHGVGLPSVAGRIEAMTGELGSFTTRIDNGRYVASFRVPLASE